jgi:hypothetical protein
MRAMPERKRPPQRKKSSYAWFWWLIVLAIVAGGIYWYWPDLQRQLLARSGTKSVTGLPAICAANVSYQYAHPKDGYARRLSQLGPAGGNYIDSALASGEKSGYHFEYTAHPEPSGTIEHYEVIARPLERGNRSYYMDEDCEVHWTDQDRPATVHDPKLQ